MAGRLSQGTLEEVQRANDIVEVVSSYIPLKRAGKDFKACCPFHREKTPSFYVSPSKQIFKCFGCGKGGSVFQFVMARENMTFPEAVRLLADRAGVKVEEVRRASPAGDGPDRSRVLKTVAWALQVFERLLQDEAGGSPARSYLSDRGFTTETLAAFRVGWAPDSWDALVRAGAKRGVDDRLLLAAGLVVPRNDGSGCYDRFRNRVMFPIFDTLNRPIAFGGRTLGDDPAKYLNSPDTVVFNKSRNLYGLTVARDGMQGSRQAIVVEGYTDCMMAHQAGVSNVVATLGTSLTRDHARLLRRYADEVVLVFDGDVAGRSAADRAVQLFLEEELQVKIVTLPEGEDPCDFLGGGRKDAFLAQVAEAPDALEYKWALVRQEFGEAGSVGGQRRAVDAMLGALAAQPVWSQSHDSLKRDLVLARMATVLGLEEKGLRERLGRLVRQAHTGRRYEEDAPADGEPPVRSEDLRSRAERLVLEVLIGSPGRIAATCERLPPEHVKEDRHRRLYEALIALQERLVSEGVSVLWSHVDDASVASLAADLAGGEAPAGDTEAATAQDIEQREAKATAMLEGALATLKRLSDREEQAAVKGRLAAPETEAEQKEALARFGEIRRQSGGFSPRGVDDRG